MMNNPLPGKANRKSAMRHLHTLTRKPEQAALAADVVITLLIDLLKVFLPLFQNKDPQNPGGGTTTPPTDTEE